jgi:hypothetical protein
MIEFFTSHGVAESTNEGLVQLLALENGCRAVLSTLRDRCGELLLLQMLLLSEQLVICCKDALMDTKEQLLHGTVEHQAFAVLHLEASLAWSKLDLM